ncbi:LysE family translocator [Salipiger mucosus]|uniref:Transporter, LysE family n=1 Tax=Salipiger mucosus DSM 16094 TaxID=1123237 RepID=S9RWR0_9RHOB|nr:Transporter, LysE family [Salipiger mucosus DSM 16094]
MIIDPLYAFVFFGLFTPGPNVILLTASGARFGIRPTLPHLFGVVVGVGVTAGLTGLGIAALLRQAPMLELGLKIAASLWILWMAWGRLDRRPAPQDRKRAADDLHRGCAVPMGEPEGLGGGLRRGVGLSRRLVPGSRRRAWGRPFPASTCSAACSGPRPGGC